MQTLSKMRPPVILVENLSKSYILRHKKQGSYVALRDVLSDKVKSVFSGNKNNLNTSEEFLALNDVSFEVKQGERVGVIGRNGAGKSTLLKILSRIVTPTKGQVTIEGRVASLLEVGTGFHPELTGRENIFLNGAILGMNRSEIVRKFDEIVSFAEVDRFLDTPVKRYSSGMYVRLAFAVAAHLEPEILIVDEVLAVGDAQFQKKCLGKMEDVSKNQGRTVLFVSHNMAAIQNLCDSCIYLHQGRILKSGPTNEVIPEYLQSAASNATIRLDDRKDRTGNGSIHFTSVEVKDNQNKNVEALQCGKDGKLCIYFDNKSEVLNNFHIAVGIDDPNGQRVTIFSNEATGQLFSDVRQRKGVVEIHLKKIPLRQGVYSFTLYSTVNGEIADWIQNAGTFSVEAGDFYLTGKLPPEGQGSFFVDHDFQLTQ